MVISITSFYSYCTYLIPYSTYTYPHCPFTIINGGIIVSNLYVSLQLTQNKSIAIKKRTKKEVVSSIRCDSPTKIHMTEQSLQYKHKLQSQRFHLLLFSSMPITEKFGCSVCCSKSHYCSTFFPLLSRKVKTR